MVNALKMEFWICFISEIYDDGSEESVLVFWGTGSWPCVPHG